MNREQITNYITEREKGLMDLIERHDYSIDKERLDELKQFQRFFLALDQPQEEIEEIEELNLEFSTSLVANALKINEIIKKINSLSK